MTDLHERFSRISIHGAAGTAAAAAASGEQSEAARFAMVKRKKDFKCMEKVDGRWVNVVQGLELHAGVFAAAEQKKIVDCVYDLQNKGRQGELRDRTYSEPIKWMRGKGRVTLQFGCCYNYAVDKHGNPPGIIRDEQVDPIPPVIKTMIKRMVEWHILPPTCIPNSCIINIYEKDDCIPPHIDHHDFVRPFCTVSLLSECNILFGTHIKILSPGDFSAPVAIPLPVGSVLILNGNGADVAKHCIPAVPTKRISITFRKMDDGKLPFRYVPDPELQSIRPLAFPHKQLQIPENATRAPSISQQVICNDTPARASSEVKVVRQEEGKKNMNGDRADSSLFKLDDFPALSSVSASRKSKPNRLLRQ